MIPLNQASPLVGMAGITTRAESRVAGRQAANPARTTARPNCQANSRTSVPRSSFRGTRFLPPWPGGAFLAPGARGPRRPVCPDMYLLSSTYR